MTSLHVICGLGLPQSKILATPMHQSQFIGGDADVDHTQIIWGDTIKLYSQIIPPIPPGFGTPGGNGS